MKQYLVVIFSRQQFDTNFSVVKALDKNAAIALAREEQMQVLRDMYADDYEDPESSKEQINADAERNQDEEYYVVALWRFKTMGMK
jgi:hypothetical protein